MFNDCFGGGARTWRTLAARPFLAAVLLLAGSPAFPIGVWEPMGPFGGDRFVVRLSPSVPGTAFVIGYHAVHRTRDEGESWELTIDPDMAHDDFIDLSFGRTDPDEILVAGATSGVWYSPDEGETWEQRDAGLPYIEGEPDHFSVTSVVVAPGDVALASLSAEIADGLPPHLVYRSDDMGLTWVPEDTGFAPLLAGEKVVSLLSADAVGGTWAILYGQGVYRHDGVVWESRNGDLPAEALRTTFLAHDPTDPDRLLLATEDAWVFESTDAGLSWSQLPLPTSLAGLPRLPLAYTAVIDPNNTDLVMVRTNDTDGSIEHPLFRPAPDQETGAGLYVSADGGSSWVRRTVFAFRLVPDPSSVVEDVVPGLGMLRRSALWYKTAGGRDAMTTSRDGGLTFQIKTQGILTTWVNDVWVHPDPPAGYDRLILVASEDGLYMSEGVPFEWSYAASAESPVYTWSFAQDFTDPGGVLYSTGSPAWNTPEKRGVYHLPLSCFGGGCIPAESQNLGSTGIWRIATTPAKPGRIFAAAQEEGVLFSDDGGQTWFPRNEGLSLPVSITDIELDGTGNPLFASFRSSNGNPGTDPPNQWPPQDQEAGGVYFWNGFNGRWELLPGLPYAAFSLDVAAGDPLTLYAATSAGVYRYGFLSGWQLVSGPILINDVELDPARPDYIYAASRIGVFRTTDGGASWQDISEGLPVRTVYSLELDPTDGTLYAGTEGGSILRLLADPDPEPVILTSPASIDFGAVPVGGFKGERKETITNTGEADLILTDIASSDPAFTLLGLPGFPYRLTPGNELRFTVRFQPTETGPAGGTLTVTGNAVNSPVAIPVNGDAYDATGFLRLTVDPPEAAWVITAPWGGTLPRVGGVPQIPLPTGIYSIEWQPVEGYLPPAEQPMQVVIQSGELTEVDAVYQPNPGEFSLGFAEYLVLEDAGSLYVDVIRTGGTSGEVSIVYETEGQTATPEADYWETSGTLTLRDGESSGVLEILINPDAITEAAETFLVRLSSPTGGAVLGTPDTALVTIVNRDPSIGDVKTGTSIQPGTRTGRSSPSSPDRPGPRSRLPSP
ncbi:MAG: choice-of-anchor D domain-containing protein [Acidobacteriota bacterium]|jgi:hypothetical protein